jgi:DNA-binding transcriptional LysR family regulator
VIYAQRAGGTVWIFRRDRAELAVTLKGRLRVTAAKCVRAALLAKACIAIASEWMFALQIANGAVKAVLLDWELPRIDLWAEFPAGRSATRGTSYFAPLVLARYSTITAASFEVIGAL